MWRQWGPDLHFLLSFLGSIGDGVIGLALILVGMTRASLMISEASSQSTK